MRQVVGAVHARPDLQAREVQHVHLKSRLGEGAPRRLEKFDLVWAMHALIGFGHLRNLLGSIALGFLLTPLDR